MAESYDEIMDAIEADVRHGMVVALLRQMENDPLNDAADPSVNEVRQKLRDAVVPDLVKLIANIEDIQAPLPMAELWMHYMETKYGRPYELVTSVVKRGDISVFFDSSRGRDMPSDFAESVRHEEWHLEGGGEIDWAAMEADADNNMVDVDYDIETNAFEAFEEVMNFGYHEDPDTGFRTTLYQTENGDVLSIPMGMVNTEDTRVDGGVDLENEDSYYSWPVGAIKYQDDPMLFGSRLARVAYGKKIADDVPNVPNEFWKTFEDRGKFFRVIVRRTKGEEIYLEWTGKT